jgi:hypothetical protein
MRLKIRCDENLKNFINFFRTKQGLTMLGRPQPTALMLSRFLPPASGRPWSDLLPTTTRLPFVRWRPAPARPVPASHHRRWSGEPWWAWRRNASCRPSRHLLSYTRRCDTTEDGVDRVSHRSGTTTLVTDFIQVSMHVSWECHAH